MPRIYENRLGLGRAGVEEKSPTKQRLQPSPPTNSRIEKAQRVTSKGVLIDSYLVALTAPAPRSAYTPLVNANRSKELTQGPAGCGVLVYGSDGEMCWRPVEGSKAWDRIVTAPINRRIETILAHREDASKLQRIVRGSDAYLYDEAVAILIAQIVCERQRIEQNSQNDRPDVLRRKKLLEIAGQVLRVDFGTNCFRLDNCHGSVIRAQPLLSATSSRGSVSFSGVRRPSRRLVHPSLFAV